MQSLIHYVLEQETIASHDTVLSVFNPQFLDSIHRHNINRVRLSLKFRLLRLNIYLPWVVVIDFSDQSSSRSADVFCPLGALVGLDLLDHAQILAVKVLVHFVARITFVIVPDRLEMGDVLTVDEELFTLVKGIVVHFPFDLLVVLGRIATSLRLELCRLV